MSSKINFYLFSILFLSILLVSSVASAQTLITDQNVSSGGNVTGVWLFGKINASWIQEAPWITTAGSGSYNITYQNFAYNQTYAGGTYNITYQNFAYNQTYTGGTFNITYQNFAYNMTQVNTGNITYTGTLYNYSIPDTSIKLYAQNHFNLGQTGGESIELIQLRPEAKPYIGWYAYDPASNSIRAAAWMGTHYNLTNGNVHQHWSIETLDNETEVPSVNTKFEISYGSNATASNGGSWAGFNSISELRLGSGVDLFFTGSSSDIESSNELDIFPGSQANLALRITNDSSNLVLTALGTGSLNFTDNLELRTNNVSASYFKGDGSLLTNLPTGNASWNQSYATSLYVLKTGDQISGTLNISTTYTTGDTGPTLNVVSRNANQSAIWVTGNETDKGTIKIAHTNSGGGDDVASALSIDLQGTSTAAKGIFITSTTGGSQGNYIHVSNGTANLFTIDNSRFRTFIPTYVTYTNESALLVEKSDGTDIFKIDTISDLVFTGKIRPRSNGSSDIGDGSFRYRSGWFSENVTASYFKGDGSLLTNLPTGNASWNQSYADTLYAGTQWGYNQTVGTQAQYGIFWYNQTVGTNNQYGQWWYNQTTTSLPIGSITQGQSSALMNFSAEQQHSANITLVANTSIIFNNRSSGIYQYYNGTCIIIKGATSQIEVC